MYTYAYYIIHGFRFKQDNIPILKNEIFFVKVIDI